MPLSVTVGDDYVAVVEFEPADSGGVMALLSCYGSGAQVSYTTVDGGPSDGPANLYTGIGEESALDIENIGILAPGTSITDYEGPSGEISDTTVIVPASAIRRATWPTRRMCSVR